MSKRLKRNHAPAFKAKVALEAQKGDQTIVELAERYQVHPNKITEWKKQLLAHSIKPNFVTQSAMAHLTCCSSVTSQMLQKTS